MKVLLPSLEGEHTLFRGNTTGTRLMTCFGQRFGSAYLRTLLKPFLEEIAANNLPLEVDQDRAGPNGANLGQFGVLSRQVRWCQVKSTLGFPRSHHTVDVAANAQRVVGLTQLLFDRLIGAASLVPSPIRGLAAHLLHGSPKLLTIVMFAQTMNWVTIPSATRKLLF